MSLETAAKVSAIVGYNGSSGNDYLSGFQFLRKTTKSKKYPSLSMVKNCNDAQKTAEFACKMYAFKTIVPSTNSLRLV